MQTGNGHDNITSEYLVSLSIIFLTIQAQLYREFSQSSAGHVVEKSLTSMKEDTQEQVGVRGHIFQVRHCVTLSLVYMIKTRQIANICS